MIPFLEIVPDNVALSAVILKSNAAKRPAINIKSMQKLQNKYCFFLRSCYLIRNRRGFMKHKLEDIARLTGFSAATVSRALNGSSWVAEATRLKILEAARKTGYLPDRKKTIALILPSTHLSFYGSAMIEPLASLIHFAGHRIETIGIRDLDLLEEHNPDAAISIVVENGLERRWGQKYAIPLLCINTNPNHLEQIYSITSNDEQGMSLLLNHLISLGHSRIGLIGYQDVESHGLNAYSAKRRISAFQKILREHNLPDDLIAGCSWNPLEMQEAVARIVKKGVSALVTISEPDAIKVLHHLKEMHIRVPEEISLCGWLSEFDLYADPPITGVMHNYDYLSDCAFVMLTRILNREPVPERDISINYNFFRRSSTASTASSTSQGSEQASPNRQ